MGARRIGIFGVDADALRLWQLLRDNPNVEVVKLWHPDRDVARGRAREVDPSLLEELDALLTDDLEAFASDAQLEIVVDSGEEPSFASQCPEALGRGVQMVSHLTARLLWAYGIVARDRKAELLQALGEVVESVELAIDSDELFERMLEIAVGVTGADGGSLMLLDEDSRELTIRVAEGVEPELFPKIRVPIGEGIAGRVAADAHPLRLRGKADREHFQIVRERLDVESALCVPLVHGGRVLGVLNVHHSTGKDAFSDEDLAFMEELAALDARIIARAQEHASLRAQAARYDAVQDIQRLLGTPDSLPERLTRFCRDLARRVGSGICNVYQLDDDEGDLCLVATSLRGGGFAGEYRVRSGEGIDGRALLTRRPAFLKSDDGLLRYVSIPLVVGERVLGLLSVQMGAGSAHRGPAAEETLHAMAAALADGLAVAEREQRMATRATRISAINEAGIRMVSAASLDEVTRLTTSSACMVLDADHAVMRLVDGRTGRYTIRSYYGAGDHALQERLFRLDKQLSVRIIKGRSPVLLRDVHADEGLDPVADHFRSVVATPLQLEGRVVGTLALYDKVAADRFYAGRFNDDDVQVLRRLRTYVERAVEQALHHALRDDQRNFDEETGLPNAGYLHQRLLQELSRAGERQGALALASCRIENFDEIEREAGAAHAHRVVLRCAEALRAGLRDFDVLGRRSEDEFIALLPEPGPTPSDRVFELARAVAEAVSREPGLNEPTRVALAFGYAVHPADGRDHAGLLEAASTPRIRMV